MANRAAFARADVEDSKRGLPALELREYAAARGLEFLDHATAAGFRVALPCEEDRQFNVMRGVLPGGAYGVLAHEALEIGYSGDSLDWGGTFHSVRVMARGGMTGMQFALSTLPVIGWFTSGGNPTARVRPPCSVAGIRVPEVAAAGVGRVRLDRRRSAPPHTSANRVKLEGGWSLFSDPAVDPALVAGPLAEALREHADDGLFQVVVESGTLLVRRNGYLDANGLDALAATAGAIAAHLRAFGAAAAQPQPFATQLPAPPVAADGPWAGWSADL